MRYAIRVPSPALALALALATVVLAPAASASHTAPPSSVALVGNLQSELGCPGDWQPECPATELVFNGSRWEATFAVPAGSWEFKVALNDSWAENYGAGGEQNGANIQLTLAAPRNVRFSYDPASHQVTDDAPLVQPSAVTIAGNLQSELGCPGDWQPECTATQLWLEPADQVWQGLFTVPAGNWEYKAPLNGSWDENYGANATRNGPNIALNLGSQQAVKFFYDHATNWVTSNRNAVIATAPGSYQSELGCPGDWQPDCLRSWLQDPDGDGLYSFETTALPAGSYEVKVAHDEAWNENYGANGVPNGANIPFTVSSAGERVVFTYDPATHVLTIGGDGPKGNLREARAHWLAEDTIAWSVPAGAAVRLHFSPDGDLEIRPAGVTGGSSVALARDGVVGGALAQKFPHLAGLPVFRLPEAELYRVPAILKQQFAVAAVDAAGRPLDATGLQPAGVLDQLYTTSRPLGVTFDGPTPTLRVWAPTARSVKLRLYDSPSDTTAQVLPMQWDWLSGTWALRGAPEWNRKYYLYEVDVFVRATGEVETNRVTDPYSLGLSMDSRHSQIVNLEDADLKPRNWDTLRKPRLAAPEDIALYELHVRDFSIGDSAVPAALRGTFAAFGLPQSHGAKHLRRLATAGLTHVHLLPAFDCATIPEDRAQQQRTGDLSGYAPDSTAQQAAVEPVRERDGFNWCYDPFHYTAPEGSYSTDPDGVVRIREFREMVAGLARLGLRAVMDVVYNHTSASGQSPKSVLDRIVPDYYHRLNAAGQVENSTCCANTATENAMMERLMVDSLVTWAKAYKVDGFRFDLMGHHSKANLLKARDTLRALTPAADGVDGRAIYLYGEGWNFGEVANDARFVQATQVNMGDGTGVGSFNDRVRDGVRGGGPFDSGADHVRRQGFANGLFVDPNAMNSGSSGERDELLRLSDWVRVGLAGSLRDFRFTDSSGNWVRGGDVDYGGQGAGYTSDPQEVINYVEAHDNETLFDINQYKLPLDASPRERVRAANLANSIVALSQGVPFFHAGQDLLRSKSFDRNSYDSGDWFNVLDFSGTINGWGRGLPPERDNLGSWPYARPRLGNPALAVDDKEIRLAAEHLREMLRIRGSSPLFRLQTGAQVEDSLRFHNTGSSQVPGLIVMTLGAAGSGQIVVVFNADPDARQYTFAPGGRYSLHPVQQESIDPVVRTARYDAATRTFSVPGRTTAVFVAGP